VGYFSEEPACREGAGERVKMNKERGGVSENEEKN